MVPQFGMERKHSNTENLGGVRKKSGHLTEMPAQPKQPNKLCFEHYQQSHEHEQTLHSAQPYNRRQ